MVMMKKHKRVERNSPGHKNPKIIRMQLMTAL
jgi:hypothetical protein